MQLSSVGKQNMEFALDRAREGRDNVMHLKCAVARLVKAVTCVVMRCENID